MSRDRVSVVSRSRASIVRLATILAIGSVLGAPACARADTVQYQAIFSLSHAGSVGTGVTSPGGTVSAGVSTAVSLTLPRFDVAKGRLTAVSIVFSSSTSTFAVRTTGSLGLLVSASEARTIAYAISVGSTTSSGSSTITQPSASLSALSTGAVEIGGAPLATTVPFTSASDLAQFTSAAEIDLTLTATDTLSLQTIASLAAGVGLSGSGTIAGNASVIYTYVPQQPVAGRVYLDANHNGIDDAGEGSTGRALFVKLAAATGGLCATSATAAAAVDPTTGAYAFARVDAGTWCLILATDANLAAATAAVPGGFVATEGAGGMRNVTIGAALVPSQDFGLYAGATVSGRVFADTGTSGGTANDGKANGGETGVAGATVTLASGANVVDGTTSDATGAYRLWLPAAAAGNVVLAATSPAGQMATGGAVGTTGGSYARGNGTAASTIAFAGAAGAAYAGADFGFVPLATFVGDGTESAVPGSTVSYAHTFVAATSGQVSFATTSPAGGGWSQVLYRDVACSGAAGPTAAVVAGPIAVVAGQRVCIVLRQGVPATATGSQNAVAVIATMDLANATPALSQSITRTDTTTVAQGNALVLSKLVRNVTRGGAFATSNAASPDDVVEYQLTVTSQAGSATSVTVADATPPYTGFVSAACPATLPPSVTGCVVSQQPAADATGAIVWTFAGTFPTGVSVTTTLQVRVRS